MKRLIIFCAIIAIFSLFIVSCYYDNEEALYPVLNTSCDTTNVSYSGTIAAILSGNCTGCHSGSVPSGAVSLTSFASVKSIAANGVLMNALKGKGVPIMPPSLPLSSCKIGQVQIWIRNGMVNN